MAEVTLAPPVKPYRVWILWGSTAYRVESGEEGIGEYDFATEAELAAFLHGVNEANGYLDCAIGATREEVLQQLRYDRGTTDSGEAEDDEEE